jgi:hypothetical protein
MNLTGKLHSLFRAPPLTRPRLFAALALAIVADGMQLLLAEVGWFGLDQAIDCVAMICISRLLGFHILLLPTFVIELIPVLDDLPTWTACTAAVIALRKREQSHPPPPASPPPAGPVIDV